MTDQSEALRLADLIDQYMKPTIDDLEVAAELRRLHAENVALKSAREIKVLSIEELDKRELDAYDMGQAEASNFILRCLDGKVSASGTMNEPAQTIRVRLLALIAERDALRRDAERYRWLRDVHANHFTVTRHVGGGTIPRFHGLELDEVLDAAMKEAK